MSKIDRRKFIKTATSMITISSISHLAFAQQRQVNEETIPAVEAISEKVWIEDQLDSAVVGEMIDQTMIKLTEQKSAKEAWKTLVKPSDVVGLKINPSAGPNLSTHRLIVDQIIEGLYGAGVLKNQIIIWDRFEKHLISAGYKIDRDGQGIQCFASDSDEIGYDEKIFYETDKDIPIRRENDSTRSHYSKIVTELTDVIINVPIMKHHAITGISGCLKNLSFGSVDNTRRFHPKPINCEPAISDIFAHQIIREKLVLNIVDGLKASFDRGPIYDANTVWKHGRIYASTDPVILDQIILDEIEDKRKEKKLGSIRSLAKHVRSASRAKIGTSNIGDADLRQVKI